MLILLLLIGSYICARYLIKYYMNRLLNFITLSSIKIDKNNISSSDLLLNLYFDKKNKLIYQESDLPKNKKKLSNIYQIKYIYPVYPFILREMAYYYRFNCPDDSALYFIKSDDDYFYLSDNGIKLFLDYIENTPQSITLFAKQDGNN